MPQFHNIVSVSRRGLAEEMTQCNTCFDYSNSSAVCSLHSDITVIVMYGRW